jgi:hypothetical protein
MNISPSLVRRARIVNVGPALTMETKTQSMYTYAKREDRPNVRSGRHTIASDAEAGSNEGSATTEGVGDCMQCDEGPHTPERGSWQS